MGFPRKGEGPCAPGRAGHTPPGTSLSLTQPSGPARVKRSGGYFLGQGEPRSAEPTWAALCCPLWQLRGEACVERVFSVGDSRGNGRSVYHQAGGHGGAPSSLFCVQAAYVQEKTVIGKPGKP